MSSPLASPALVGGHRAGAGTRRAEPTRAEVFSRSWDSASNCRRNAMSSNQLVPDPVLLR